MRYGIAILFILLIVVAVPNNVMAVEDPAMLRREALLDATFARMSAKFGIPKDLVKAIARQESDCHPLMININGKDYRPKTVREALWLCEYAASTGLSYDVGIMQVNRYWIRKYKIPHRMLLSPADNIYMGCFILSGEIRRYGLTWKAVGKYHSPKDWRGARYSRKILAHLRDILSERGNG